MKIQLKPELDQCVIVRQDVVVAIFFSVAWMTSHQTWQHCVLPQGDLDMFKMIMAIIIKKSSKFFKQTNKEPVQTIFNEPVQTEPESHLLQVHEERPRDQETSLW